MTQRSCPILLLALGNDILGDDGVALLAARELRDEFSGRIDIVETIESGLSLMDFMEGYRRALLIDSIISGDAKPGDIREFSGEDFLGPRIPSIHRAGLPEVLGLADMLKMDFPEEIRILAMEIEDPYEFGAKLTPAVEEALPRYIEQARSILNKWLEAGK